jgi:hypothetical protein
MQKWAKGKASKEEKLTFIQNFLSGMLDLTTYRPPKNYTVMLENNKATVKHYNSEDLELTLEQYELWRQSLSEQDLLFVVNVQDFSAKDAIVIPGDSESQPVIFRPDPRFKSIANEWEEIKTYNEPEGQDLRERVKDEPKEQPKREARKSPKNEVTNDLPADENLPVLPNYGKLSEYGQTWKLRRN